VSDVQVIWNDPDDPAGNTAHTARNGLTPGEVDEVLLNKAVPTATSSSSGRPCKFGWTSTGKHIIVIWEQDDDVDPPVVVPITAYEVAPQA
jgi:hypothetical protein